MNEILSKQALTDAAEAPEIGLLRLAYYPRMIATIDALATALNAHPENPTELKAHKDLVDMLREKGWIE